MKNKKVIYWFRNDLRLSDNPALNAVPENSEILPIYILDENSSDPKNKRGGASRFWLHHALNSLSNSLDQKLSIYIGNSLDILKKLINLYDIEEIYWNRCYEPWSIKRDKEIKKELNLIDVTVNSYNGFLLWEPWNILKDDGTPYRVFTPFYRKGCLNALEPRRPLDAPRNLKLFKDVQNSNTVNSLSLLPKNIRWDKKLEQYWDISEEGAHKRLKKFLENGLFDYKKARDFPAQDNTSMLSPYLHFGQISPNQVWYSAISGEIDDNVNHFCSELGWREFSYNLIYYNPKLSSENLQKKFDKFEWRTEDRERLLELWQKGKTGVPIIDAGMRQLWETGYMHNRVRMIVGSFLVKNLLIDWRYGERWFWDCLVDADIGNNSAGWQWVAGCGADAAPYFRIFNPILQAQKFDPEGKYIKKYVPELKKLSLKYLFAPWEAPRDVLKNADIELGDTYPNLIIDIKKSRNVALEKFQAIS